MDELAAADARAERLEAQVKTLQAKLDATQSRLVECERFCSDYHNIWGGFTPAEAADMLRVEAGLRREGVAFVLRQREMWMQRNDVDRLKREHALVLANLREQLAVAERTSAEVGQARAFKKRCEAHVGLQRQEYAELKEKHERVLRQLASAERENAELTVLVRSETKGGAVQDSVPASYSDPTDDARTLGVLCRALSGPLRLLRKV